MVKNRFLLLLLLLPTASFAVEPWWNNSWQYRVEVNISTGSYARQDAPIELAINFTSLLAQLNDSYGFDENSVRVVSQGSELSSQYHDLGTANDGYGQAVWLLNGTTSSSTTRTFFIYFDSDNNSKSAPSYAGSWGSINPGANTIENQWLKIGLGYADTLTGIIDFIIKSESNQDQSNNAVASNGRVEALYVNRDNVYSSLVWTSVSVEDGPVRKTIKATGVQNPHTVYEEVSIYYSSPFIFINRTSSTATNYTVLGLGTPGGDASRLAL